MTFRYCHERRYCVLQFGHSQKAVENSPGLVLSSGLRSVLQFGHSQKAVENPSPKERLNRSYSSFNSATAKRPWRTLLTLQHVLILFLLQFGHSQKAVENDLASRGAAARCRFNSATAKRPWRTPALLRRSGLCGVDMLQFGHSQKAVENRCHRAAGTVPGADQASIRPQPKGRGEQDLGAEVTGSGPRLQFGHSQKAVENATVPWIFRPTRPASIRPQPKGRGEPRSSPPQEPGPRRFNSATAKRPWRTGDQRRLLVELQFGHSQKAVDALVLQFGHSQKAVENQRPQPKGRGRSLQFGHSWRTPSAGQFGHSQKAVENRCTCRRGFNSATAKRPWRT